MPAASQDLHALWSSHRGLLHSPSAWNLANPAVSLTYVPTGAGFTGPAQLQRFCALFPPEHHPFHADQIFRYNNQCQTVGCAVDEQQRVLTEEIVLSSLHLERLDYLMPGVEATRRAFASPFVAIFALRHRLICRSLWPNMQPTAICLTACMYTGINRPC